MQLEQTANYASNRRSKRRKMLALNVSETNVYCLLERWAMENEQSSVWLALICLPQACVVEKAARHN